MAPATASRHNFSLHTLSGAITTTISLSGDLAEQTTVVIRAFITTPTILAIENQVFPCVVADSKTADNIDTNVDDHSAGMPDGWAFTTSLATSATLTACTLDTSVTLAAIRRGRDGGTRSGATMAVTRLIFVPTLLLMIGSTIVARSTTTSVLHPLAIGSSSTILLITLICEVVTVVVEAFKAALPSMSDTEMDDTFSTVTLGEHLKLVPSCLAVIASILFLVGTGSLALECASAS